MEVSTVPADRAVRDIAAVAHPEIGPTPLRRALRGLTLGLLTGIVGALLTPAVPPGSSSRREG